MAWFVKNYDGSEEVFQNEPSFNRDNGYWSDADYINEVKDILGITVATIDHDSGVDVPCGTILKLTGVEIPLNSAIELISY